MTRYLFILTKECCEEEDCPGNGRITHVLVTEDPEQIQKINFHLSCIGDADDEDDEVFGLPMNELIAVADALKLDPELAEWWRE